MSSVVTVRCREEVLLVVEVLVDGLLGYPGRTAICSIVVPSYPLTRNARLPLHESRDGACPHFARFVLVGRCRHI